MYERRDDIPRPSPVSWCLPGTLAAGPHSVEQARERITAEFEAFGFYADRVSTPEIKPNNVTAPAARAAGGKRVTVRLALASGPGAGAGKRAK